MNFPINVFEDVTGKDFSKHNKKHVTEDYVSENFKECGWKVFRPFNDTGIDLIATKKCCPKNHTQFYDETSNQDKCEVCKENLITIKRFIQVKTREVKGDEAASQFFGYTLKSKDFRTDPRHVFLLYSDYTNDFIIIPMYEYLKIFHDTEQLGKGHFGTPSFRQGNNKLNGLRKFSDGHWAWKTRGETTYFDKFVNNNGMQLIMNPNYDLKIDEFIEKIFHLKFSLYYNYSKGRQVDEVMESKIKKYLQMKVTHNLKSISADRKKTREKLKKELSPQLVSSIEYGYLVKFKGVSFNE